jgi:hypothetical protein
MSLVYGYLFEWPTSSEALQVSRSEAFQSAVESIRSFRLAEDHRINDIPRWTSYRFESLKPLHTVDGEPLFRDTPYTYSVFVRVNDKTSTVVIAAARYSITDEVVRLFNTTVRPMLKRKSINVRGLSDYLLNEQKRKRFFVTYLLGDVPAYGSALTSISLHGDDIAAAEFSLPEGAALTARQIGVRLLTPRMECARFGTLGSVQFRTDLAAEFEQFLTYAYDRGFLTD